jgi:hypothetical protein
MLEVHTAASVEITDFWDIAPYSHRFHDAGSKQQGRIKGFVCISSLGPFGDLRSIVGTKVYSRLSGLMEGEGMHT